MSEKMDQLQSQLDNAASQTGSASDLKVKISQLEA